MFIDSNIRFLQNFEQIDFIHLLIKCSEVYEDYLPWISFDRIKIPFAIF